MTKKRKIKDAKNGSKGNISAVRLDGNSTFISLETAIKMAEQGKVDVVVVNQSNGKQHIRTRPDQKKGNNLDELART